jgi:hypothetical protein
VVNVMGASADGINAILALREPQELAAQWLIFALGQGYEVSVTPAVCRRARLVPG